MQIFVPTHPLEVELAIKPKLEGYFDAEILHPNGSIERPFDKPAQNTILSAYLDEVLSRGSSLNGTMHNIVFGPGNGLVVGTSNGANSRKLPAFSSFANLANVSPLDAPVMSTTTRAATGNSSDINTTNGNALLTLNCVFAAAPTAMTLREACLTQLAGSTFAAWWQGNIGNQYWTLNRVVLPTPIVLNAGDVLTMSFTLVIPTLAITPQTISLPAQNGMNLSGQLKLIGTAANILGGTVTADGTRTPLQGSDSPGTSAGGAIVPFIPAGGLTTATAFPTQLTNTTGMNTNVASSSAYATYARGSLFRDFATTWNSAFATTNFRSVTLYLGNGTYGYQLLLDAQQTKESGKTLSINWRFALS